MKTNNGPTFLGCKKTVLIGKLIKKKKRLIEKLKIGKAEK